jgi:hypothetical protein
MLGKAPAYAAACASVADLSGPTYASISPSAPVPTTVPARGCNRPQTTPRQPSRQIKTPR